MIWYLSVVILWTDKKVFQSKVKCLLSSQLGGGPCKVRSKNMFDGGRFLYGDVPMWVGGVGPGLDRHDWKYFLPAASMVGGNKNQPMST